jgi:hypothetical protein
MSSTKQLVVAVKIPALNFELKSFDRTIRALAHTEWIDYGHEKLSRHIKLRSIYTKKICTLKY